MQHDKVDSCNRSFVEECLPDLLQDVSNPFRMRLWFQHDGVPAHYSTVVSNHQDAPFLERWFGSANFCDSKMFSSLEYPLLLRLRVKYLASLN